MNSRLNIHGIVNLINNQYIKNTIFNKQKNIKKLYLYRQNSSKCAVHSTEPIFSQINCGVVFKILQPTIYK